MDGFAILTLIFVLAGASMAFIYNLKIKNESDAQQEIIKELNHQINLKVEKIDSLTNKVLVISSEIENISGKIKTITDQIDATTQRNEIISTNNLQISSENSIITSETKDLTQRLSTITENILIESNRIRNKVEGEAYFKQLNTSPLFKEFEGGFYLVWQKYTDQINEAQVRAFFDEDKYGEAYENLGFHIDAKKPSLWIANRIRIDPKKNITQSNIINLEKINLDQIGVKQPLSDMFEGSNCKTYFILTRKDNIGFTYAVGQSDCQ